LAFLSEFGRVHDSESGLVSRTTPWTLWYMRATVRELGLPSAILDSTYQWRILDATRIHEIEKQIKYHTTTHESAHRIDRFLHWCGLVCFSVTFLILFSFLICYVANLEWPFSKPWELLFTAGLPAFGAALSSVRVHGEFETSAQRSALMIDSLTLLKKDYEAAMRRENDLDDTAESLISASRIMSEDLAAWEDLYGRKRLVLPA